MFTSNLTTHPPYWRMMIPESINKQLSEISSEKECLLKSKYLYQEALNKTGYKYDLSYSRTPHNSYVHFQKRTLQKRNRNQQIYLESKKQKIDYDIKRRKVKCAWMSDWLIDQSLDRSLGCLFAFLFDWLIGWLISNPSIINNFMRLRSVVQLTDLLNFCKYWLNTTLSPLPLQGRKCCIRITDLVCFIVRNRHATRTG